MCFGFGLVSVWFGLSWVGLGRVQLVVSFLFGWLVGFVFILLFCLFCFGLVWLVCLLFVCLFVCLLF